MARQLLRLTRFVLCTILVVTVLMTIMVDGPNQDTQHLGLIVQEEQQDNRSNPELGVWLYRGSDFITHEDGRENVEEMQLLFLTRKKFMNRVCKHEVSNRAQTVPLNHKEFLINREFKIVWCSIFKSASSSWFAYFLTLAGKNPNVRKNSEVELARKTAYPRPSMQDLQEVLNDPSYTSFVILREPFQRILSSYLDKIAGKEERYYHSVRCKMTKQKRRTSKPCFPTFPQYVDYILEQYAAGKMLDEHWQPYTLFCSLCQVNFTYVLAFENIAEEQNFLLNHVEGLQNYPLKHEHSSEHNYSAQVREHYSQLSRAQLDGLVDIYKDDFLISGHSWIEYYEYIQ
ncbi:carbohydrate sulfotransferase 10 [Hyalella azteca]|uniref:Carbohydrate sulfotransferase n=1 Tax=Hyalella azteca TaxID=294128 RepID=A0A8B7PBZ5_HYAAZ|nr:carbohydrate sulfotransferase 10 [Hyalella azteca]